MFIDPSTQDIEISGIPLGPYAGFLSTIDIDGGTGTIDSQTPISGNYDANGLAVITVGDLENPGFTLVFSTGDGGGLGTDLDAVNDRVLDSVVAFGTVYDAISIPDDNTDSGYYGGQLGGADFVYSGDEPKLVFRDGLTGAWYAVNDQGFVPENVFDIYGNQVANNLFSADPEVTTFGALNPTLIPEPSVGLLALVGCLALYRLRRNK